MELKISSKILWIAAIGSGAYFYFKSKADTIIGNIEQSFSGIQWNGFKGGRANFALTYKIKNKNPETVYVFGFKGLLTWRNNPFADIAAAYNDKNPFVLKTMEEQTFPIYFSVPIGDLVADLYKLLYGQRPTNGANYEGMYVKGTLDCGIGSLRAGIPIKEAIVLSI